jgi:hypothetical protein
MTERRSTRLKEKKNNKNAVSGLLKLQTKSPKKKFKPLETLINVRVQEIEDNVGKYILNLPFFPNSNKKQIFIDRNNLRKKGNGGFNMKFIKDLEKQYKKVLVEYAKNNEKLMLNLFAKGHKY